MTSERGYLFRAPSIVTIIAAVWACNGSSARVMKALPSAASPSPSADGGQQSSGKHEEEPVTESAPNVLIDCKIEQSPDHLRITYTFQNASTEDVFINNIPQRKWGADQQGVQPWGGVYEAGHGVANVVLGDSRSPPWETPASYNPNPSRVGPGASVRATLSLPLPLREWNVYYPPYGSGVGDKFAPGYSQFERRQIASVRFIVDFVRSSANLFKIHPTLDGSLSISGNTESAWCELPLDTPVGLERRAGHDPVANRGWEPPGSGNIFVTVSPRRGTKGPYSAR